MTPPLLRLHLETIKEKEREGRRGDASYSTTDDIYLITTSSLIAGEIFSIPFSKNIVAFVFVAILIFATTNISGCRYVKNVATLEMIRYHSMIIHSYISLLLRT